MGLSVYVILVGRVFIGNYKIFISTYNNNYEESRRYEVVATSTTAELCTSF